MWHWHIATMISSRYRIYTSLSITIWCKPFQLNCQELWIGNVYSWHNIVRMFWLRNKYCLDKSQRKESWRLASTCDKWFSKISVLSEFLCHQMYFSYANFLICFGLTLTKFKSCEQKHGQYEYYVKDRIHIAQAFVHIIWI